MKLIITNITEDNKLEVLKKIEERYPDVRWNIFLYPLAFIGVISILLKLLSYYGL